MGEVNGFPFGLLSNANDLGLPAGILVEVENWTSDVHLPMDALARMGVVPGLSENVNSELASQQSQWLEQYLVGQELPQAMAAPGIASAVLGLERLTSEVGAMYQGVGVGIVNGVDDNDPYVNMVFPPRHGNPQLDRNFDLAQLAQLGRQLSTSPGANDSLTWPWIGVDFLASESVADPGFHPDELM